MSAISSTQAGQGLAQFLQGLSSSSPASATSASSSTTASALTGASTTAGKTKGHHHGSSAAFEKLLQTVTTALQSAQSSGSTADPNQTIENALEKIFKNGTAGSTAGSSTAGSGTAGSGTAGSGTAAATAPATTAAGDTSTADAAKQSFLSTLQSFGVTPQQFQQDLATALQQANGGTANPATAFASFPPGSLIDTVG
jgi:hypothetical protein